MLKTATLTAIVTVWAFAASAQPVDMSAAIREEGLQNSQAFAYVSDLTDNVGARLMGSPNMRKAYEWSLTKMKALGLANPHLDPMGDFGLSWKQDNAWLRMSAPDSMVLLAQAAPWSVSSDGPKEAEVVAVELSSPADLDKHRGKLKGKIVLLGPQRILQPITAPLWRRWTDEEVISGKAAEAQRAFHENLPTRLAQRERSEAFIAQRSQFLREEGILAMVVPSRDNDGNGGTGNIIVDGYGPQLTQKGWTAEGRLPFPVLVVSAESFGRPWRLAQAGKPVKMQFEVQAPTLSEHEPGYNVVAEIPGTDPKLKSEIVLLGAHLDSWGAGTGALDNGTGVAATLEVMRILKAIDAKPRRTIRIVLFAAEEQELVGSRAYVAKHFGRSTTTPPRSGEVIGRGDLKTLPAYESVSAYYNMDDGSGRIRGVYAGGNTELTRIFSDWIKPLGDLGVLKVFAHRYYPADQSSFEEVGLPGVSFLQDGLDYGTRAYHSNLDTLERVSPTDLAQAATVMAIFVMKTANRDDRLPRVEPQ